jgi:hypothetical protein
MNRQEVMENIGTIARSGTKSFFEKFREEVSLTALRKEQDVSVMKRLRWSGKTRQRR